MAGLEIINHESEEEEIQEPPPKRQATSYKPSRLMGYLPLTNPEQDEPDEKDRDWDQITELVKVQRNARIYSSLRSYFDTQKTHKFTLKRNYSLLLSEDCKTVIMVKIPMV